MSDKKVNFQDILNTILQDFGGREKVLKGVREEQEAMRNREERDSRKGKRVQNSKHKIKKV